MIRSVDHQRRRKKKKNKNKNMNMGEKKKRERERDKKKKKKKKNKRKKPFGYLPIICNFFFKKNCSRVISKIRRFPINFPAELLVYMFEDDI